MKDMDLEMLKPTMDDSNDYDEYEEEVIDRDEEYEVDDDEDEYDDEEYDDEDYGDEEEYDDEYDDGYDDGYDDSYYDERLNKVLDELAELKRNMANPPAVQNNQPSYAQPTIPYVFAGNIPQDRVQQGYGSEVLMYNEISRLRDELSKTQSSQNLHVELNRLKDEMERDRKYNESQYLAEIKRLNEKVETLQKNSLGPQSEDNINLLESRASEGGMIDSGSFNKLIAINESILQNTKTSDSHVQSELGDIKKRLAALDGEELSRALSAVKKLSKTMNAEDMTALTAEITALKNALAGSGMQVAEDDGSVGVRLRELKEVASDKDTDGIILLRKIGELSEAIGYADDKEKESKRQALALIDEFLALRSAPADLSLGDKLGRLSDLEKKVSVCNTSEAVALAGACDSYADEILRAPLDKKSIDELVRFADDTGVFSVSREKREALDKFATLSQRLSKCDKSEIAEVLPQLLEAKAKLQDRSKQSYDEHLSKEISKCVSDGDEGKQKELIGEICKLRAADFVRYPRVNVDYTASEHHPIATLIEKADSIIAMLGERGAAVDSVPEKAENAEDVSLQAFKDEIVGLCTAKQLDDAVAELRSEYVKIVNALASLPEGAVSAETASAVSAIADEAQYNNNELSEQMYNIRDELSKAIHDESQLTQDTLELKFTDFSDIQRRVADDLEFIRNKLAETGKVIESAASVREESEQTSAEEKSDSGLYDDICVQFDKLYEDVSALLTTTENNVVERLGETVGSTMDNVNEIIDSINANIDNINALVSGVNTSLDGVNSNFDITNNNINNINTTFGDSFANVTLVLDEIRENLSNLAATDVSVLLADNVTELKMAVDDFIAKATAYDDAALNDRLRLVDDVAFLRQNAESGAAESINTLHDELTLLGENLTRDLNVLTDTVSGLNLDEMRENVLTVKDTLDILAADTSVAAMGEDIAEIKENAKSLSDALTADFAAQEELIGSLKDDVAFIRAHFDEQSDENAITVTDVYDVLVGVNEKLDSVSEVSAKDTQTVLDLLDEIKEQLHLKELEPSIEGVTGSEEEKQTLLNEIAEVRERLTGLENASTEQSDAASATLANIEQDLNDIKESIAVSDRAVAADSVLTDISEKLELIMQDSANMNQLTDIAADISEMKGALALGENTESDGMADIMQTVNDMSDRVKEFAERMELAAVEIDSIPLVLSELGQVKQSLEEIKEKLSEFEGVTPVHEDAEDESDAIARRLDILSDKTNEIIERSENGVVSDELREVTDEIAEIRESLLTDYEKIKDDISFIRNQIELNVEEAESDTALDLGDEDINTILEELAEIKEKLAAADEYDIMSEILSLKEDMKAVRAPSEEGGEPTGDELNMVLSEIVALRDEIQSYKDQLTAYRPVSENDDAVRSDSGSESDALSDNVNIILDELTDLRSELAGLRDESAEKQSELRDMIARRTTIGTESADADSAVSAQGLDVVLDEIVNLKNDFASAREQISDEIKSTHEHVQGDVADETLDGRLDAIEDSISALGDRITELFMSDDLGTHTDKSEEILAEVRNLRENRVAVESDEGALDVLSEMLLLHSEINDIRNILDNAKPVEQSGVIADTAHVSDADYADVLSQLVEIKERLAEKEAEKPAVDGSLMEELSAIKEMLFEQSRTSEIEILRDEIVGLRQELASADYGNVSAESSDTEIAALREEIAELKEQLAASREQYEPDMAVMTEITALRDEIASLKEQMAQGGEGVSATSAEPDMTVLTEVMALREEIGELKNALVTPDSDMVETVAQIREDVRAMKDEPDLSALNEVLALRDEFQAMKDEIAEKKSDDAHTKSSEEILAEVQSLRDQLFAISMANVNDGSTDKVTYESYNNIILDEITALREEVNAYKTSDAAREVMDEIAEIKQSIAAQTADEGELMIQLSKLKSDLETLKNSDAQDATNNAILTELANLKSELTNQREADLTTLNFMSEMAQLIERQNQYINQSANSKISDEIESLKAEIASSLAAPSVETSAIMNEIAKLKDEISRDTGNKIDNKTILDELAKLKDEISVEKPSRQNDLVLEEIARLKDEISSLSERNANDDSDVSVEEISQSINDLKNELTQIADIVSDEEKPKKAPARKTASKTSSAKKKTSAAKGRASSKKTSAKSSARKSSASKKSTVKSTSSLSSDELLSKIDAVSIDIPANTETGGSDFNVHLDPNFVPDKERDEMDIASKLAKQVANKLIMEQLVEQLGNGGVPENEVEEIVKDILPQEFSTVMIEEQSDQVRRLANSLVLDKLRARLTGRKDED